MTRQFIILMAFAMFSTAGLIAFGVWNHVQPAKYHANTQLCRLDLAQPLDQSEVRAAKQLLKGNSEVSHVHYSASSNAMVVGLKCTGPKAGNAVESLIASFKSDLNIDARPYETDPANLASGCPITGQKGIIPRVKNFFTSIF